MIRLNESTVLTSTLGTHVQVYNYKYTSTRTQVQVLKYKYISTSTQVQVHKYKYTSTINNSRLLSGSN